MHGTCKHILNNQDIPLVNVMLYSESYLNTITMSNIKFYILSLFGQYTLRL